MSDVLTSGESREITSRPGDARERATTGRTGFVRERVTTGRTGFAREQVTGIKICGMRREEDIEAANRCRPDYVGFILSQGYRRSVSPETAEKLSAMVAPGILKVGVFVDEAVEQVLEASGFLDMIQLHGKEDNAYIRELREAAGKPIIKAFRIRSAEDLKKAAESEADMVLLDNGTGTGQVFDWSLIEEAEDLLEESGKPWILAGGLGPENVAEAVRKFRPCAVDLSSGAETDGWKDPVKMERCVREVLLRPQG